MKRTKVLAKFVSVLIISVIIYSFLFHYSVESLPKINLQNTFIATDDFISQIADTKPKTYDVLQDNLNEQIINKNGFYIRIDKINLFKPVVLNVDPRYKDEYVDSWKTGVSHGKFTGLPDEISNVYLFAHAVSDLKRLDTEHAWFTRIDELVENDSIVIYYKSKKYTYQISRIYSVAPTATGVYTGVSPVPKVTLQTCGPPRGSLSSRYMVEALLVKTEDF